jgi:hypothetical protein
MEHPLDYDPKQLIPWLHSCPKVAVKSRDDNLDSLLGLAQPLRPASEYRLGPQLMIVPAARALCVAEGLLALFEPDRIGLESRTMHLFTGSRSEKGFVGWACARPSRRRGLHGRTPMSSAWWDCFGYEIA